MYTLLLILFLLVCILMTVAILLQSSKGGGLAGAFGGGMGMGAVFGGRGAATFLSKLTTWLAVFYLVLAFGLTKLQPGKSTPENKSIVAQHRGEIAGEEGKVTDPAALLPPVQQSIPAAAGTTGALMTPVTPDTSK